VDNKKKVSGLGAPGDLYRYIPESFKITEAYAKEQSHGDGFKKVFY
jgi:hypothetical protein